MIHKDLHNAWGFLFLVIQKVPKRLKRFWQTINTSKEVMSFAAMRLEPVRKILVDVTAKLKGEYQCF